MGALLPQPPPKWAFRSKREGAPWGLWTAGIVALAVIGCVYTLAPAALLGDSSRLRVRLKLATALGQTTWEAQGTEGEVQDTVAALGAAALEQIRRAADAADSVPNEREVAQVTAALKEAGDGEEPGAQQGNEDGEQQQPQEGEQVPDTSAQQQQQQDDQEQAEAADDAGGEAAGSESNQGERPGGAGEAAMTPFVESAEVGREFTQAFTDCDNIGQFDCLTQQASKALGTFEGRRQFRFPPFYLVGYQKCATTSLFHHLVEHPQIERARIKEPEFFTRVCGYNMYRCVTSQKRKYMRDTLMFRSVVAANFTKAAFEGSTHYGLEGPWLAMQLREVFPWIKIVISMREPISQAISMLNHQLDKDRIPDCYDKKNDLVYDCIFEDLDFESRYATSLAPWVKHIPRQQLHVLQYENLTSDAAMAPALRELKAFLEIDPTLPSDDLGIKNFRHQRKNGHKEGWAMTRSQYESLVGKARRNAEEVVEIVRQQGFADADAWMDNWKAAWQRNLDERCEPGPEGECTILVT